MTREQLTWAGGGLVLGFVGGFLVAYVMLARAREALDRVEAREPNMEGAAALRQELQRLESQTPPDEEGPG